MFIDLVTETEYVERHAIFSVTLQYALNTSFRNILARLIAHPLWGEIMTCINCNTIEKKSFTFFFEQMEYSIPIWDEQSKLVCTENLRIKDSDIIGWLYFITASAIAGFFVDISLHLQSRINSIPKDLNFHSMIIDVAKYSNTKWPSYTSNHLSTRKIIEMRTLALNGKNNSFKLQHAPGEALIVEHSSHELRSEGALNISYNISSLKKRNIFVPIKKSKLNSNSTMDSRAGLFSQDSYIEREEPISTSNVHVLDIIDGEINSLGKCYYNYFYNTF
jgi:hypothetical protein